MNLFVHRKFIVLEIHPVFLRPQNFLQTKIFYSKLQSTPKREIFLQDKIKSHGKAGACRDFLKQYCGKRSGLERTNP
jgi:hypothetical protein